MSLCACVQEISAFDLLIGDLLAKCKLREAVQVATCFGHYSQDLSIITVGL